MAKRILLIEDDVEVRNIFECMLRNGGYEVDCVGSAREGGLLLEALNYDLVLADGRLGDGNGLTLAGTAVAQGAAALVVTGDEWTFAKCRHAHQDVLLKPILGSELLAAVGRKIGPTRS